MIRIQNQSSRGEERTAASKLEAFSMDSETVVEALFEPVRPSERFSVELGQ